MHPLENIGCWERWTVDLTPSPSRHRTRDDDDRKLTKNPGSDESLTHSRYTKSCALSTYSVEYKWVDPSSCERKQTHLKTETANKWWWRAIRIVSCQAQWRRASFVSSPLLLNIELASRPESVVGLLLLVTCILVSHSPFALIFSAASSSGSIQSRTLRIWVSSLYARSIWGSWLTSEYLRDSPPCFRIQHNMQSYQHTQFPSAPLSHEEKRTKILKSGFLSE